MGKNWDFQSRSAYTTYVKENLFFDTPVLLIEDYHTASNFLQHF